MATGSCEKGLVTDLQYTIVPLLQDPSSSWLDSLPFTGACELAQVGNWGWEHDCLWLRSLFWNKMATYFSPRVISKVLPKMSVGKTMLIITLVLPPIIVTTFTLSLEVKCCHLISTTSGSCHPHYNVRALSIDNISHHHLRRAEETYCRPFLGHSIFFSLPVHVLSNRPSERV